jgi:uncharacterized protein YjbI with pentapeptide repeats
VYFAPKCYSGSDLIAEVIPALTVASHAIRYVLRTRSKGVTIMTIEDKSQIPLFSPEGEKEAQKELKRLRANEKEVFKTNHKRTGFEDKTLWDKLNLFGTLAIPLVVVLATIGFGLLQLQLADVQHQQDQQSALDQQWATILQTYIDNIQDLLLHDNLRGSKIGDEVAILARARTLTALHGLDPVRKGRLVQFIYEAQLIGFLDSKNNLHSPIIDLSDADLSDAFLFFAYLNGANLIRANLIRADLSDANLSDANFSDADLYLANLNGAILNGAILNGAILTQQQLDQVNSCKNAILPTGLTCHHNQ